LTHLHHIYSLKLTNDIERLREFSVLDVLNDLEQTRLYSLFYYQAFASELGTNTVEYLHTNNNEKLGDTAHVIFDQLKKWGLA
jgi:hypothetical protein